MILKKIAYGVATQRDKYGFMKSISIIPNIEIQKQIINQFKIMKKWW